jgi:hypothetical protein
MLLTLLPIVNRLYYSQSVEGQPTSSGLFYDPEDVTDTFLRTFGWRSTDYTALYTYPRFTAVRSSNPARSSVTQ